ncbi:MAG: V-type ATP synthase subunit I, partial [Thermoplasmata archaeon]
MGFLRPVPMVKVGLLGLREDRERAVALLHDLKVLQVEPLRKEAAALLPSAADGEAAQQVADALLRFRTLKGALPPSPARGPPPSFADREAVFAAAQEVTIDPEVRELASEEDRLATERKEVGDLRELLRAHAYYPEPLGLLRSGALLAYFGEAPAEAFERLRGEVGRIGEAVFVPHPTATSVKFLLAVPRPEAEAIGRIAQTAGIRLQPAPELDGPIAEEGPRLDRRLAAIDRRRAEIRKELGALSEASYGRVAALEEALTIENRKFESLAKMGAGASSFAVEGWLPRRELPRLRSALDATFGDRVHLEEIPSSEEPPTLMDNPPGIRWFEFFIRFYAIPQATEFDPTWIFAIAFPIFFGFMLGDVGYGLIILTISLWMIAGFPGRTHLPRSLRSFLTMIMGPKGMQMLARTLLPGCAIAIGLGIIYNDWFGFHLPFYHGLFDPVTQVGTLLVIAGYIGLIMVSAGFFLGAVRAYWHHRYRHILTSSGGIAFAWGVAEVGLIVLHRAFSFSGAATDASLGLVVGGLVLILAGEGGQGLMALSEIVSHILSYTRLVGILLASVILAVVVNSIAVSKIENTNGSIGVHIAFLLLGVVILIGGQT